MTLVKAVWNLAISSGVPTLTRTELGQMGQVRPMKTFSACMAAMTWRPGLPTSIMKQLETEGDEVVAAGLEEVEGLVAGVGDDLAARGDECWVLEAGAGSADGGDGHGVHAVGLEPGEEVGAAHGGTGADAGHAVDLGEGAEDDEVLTGGDEFHDVGRAGEVDVGLVDEEDGALGLVLEGPCDLFLGGEGAGGVVGVADVDDAGVGRGGRPWP